MESGETTYQVAEKLLVIKKYFNRTGGKSKYAEWYENAIQGDLRYFRSRIDEQYNSIIKENYEDGKVKARINFRM